MARPYLPRLEPLHQRCLPSAGWHDPGRLTLSFAPDGTAVLNHTSGLFALLGTEDVAAWQREILRAFQTWAAAANLNVGLVPDDGSDFGGAGLAQGDPRFGDIRIAAFAQSPEVLAVATPPDVFAGTWSGDVFLNALVNFTRDGVGGPDLFSVLLHEAGHSLGLEHADDAGSVMHAALGSVLQRLTDADVARLQAIYGARQPDAFEGNLGNETPATAALLTSERASSGNVTTLTATGDVTTLTDVDYYSFRTAGNTAAVTVTLHTAGLSLLQARLTVTNADGVVLGTAVADGSFGTDLVLQLTGDVKQEELFVRVESATGDVFGVGGYTLQVDVTSDGKGGGQKPNAKAPGGGPPGDVGPSPDRAVRLNPKKADGSEFRVESGLGSGVTAEWFRVKAPNAQQLDPDGTLHVLVRVADWPAWQPTVRVFDNHGEPVAAEVLIAGDGTALVQITGVQASQDYLIEVSAEVLPPEGAGAYFLGVRFNEPAVTLTTLAQGELADGSADTVTLQVAENQLYHLLLTSTPVTGATVYVTVFEVVAGGTSGPAAGVAVASFSAAAGTPLSTNALLPAGDYILRIEVEGGDGALSYHLGAKILSDPVGPQHEDLLVPGAFPGTGGTTTPPTDAGGTTTPPPPGSGGTTAPPTAGGGTTTPPTSGSPTTLPGTGGGITTPGTGGTVTTPDGGSGGTTTTPPSSSGGSSGGSAPTPTTPTTPGGTGGTSGPVASTPSGPATSPVLGGDDVLVRADWAQAGQAAGTVVVRLPDMAPAANDGTVTQVGPGVIGSQPGGTVAPLTVTGPLATPGEIAGVLASASDPNGPTTTRVIPAARVLNDGEPPATEHSGTTPAVEDPSEGTPNGSTQAEAVAASDRADRASTPGEAVAAANASDDVTAAPAAGNDAGDPADVVSTGTHREDTREAAGRWELLGKLAAVTLALFPVLRWIEHRRHGYVTLKRDEGRRPVG